MIPRKYVLAAAIIPLMLYISTLAQHWPEDLIAKGRPDAQLLGMRVGEARIGDALKALGNPTEQISPYSALDNGTGSMRYTWQQSNATIVIDTEWYMESGKRLETIYSISIASSQRNKKYATERGLCIGDSKRKMHQLYGHVYQLSKAASEERYCYCFEDESKEYITINSNDRVIRLWLVAPVE